MTNVSSQFALFPGTSVSEKSVPTSQSNKSPSKAPSSETLAIAAAKVCEENNAQEIVILDMRSATALFDYFVIATGTSLRQLRAIAEEIQNKLEKELNDRRYSNHSIDRSNWVVLDYGTVVVHLFDEETRQFYSLEALWGDSPRVKWQAESA